MTAPDRVAYLVSRYPFVSHTFIEREVNALRQLGVEVDTFSVRKVPPAAVLGQAAQRERATTTVLVPPTPAVAARAIAFVLRHPLASLTTVARAISGRPRALRRLAYAFEAIELVAELRARRITHVHAHFANVAADVAWLARDLGHALGAEWHWGFTMHGPTEFADPRRYGLAPKVSNADLVVCISDYCRSQLMALVPPDRWDHLEVVHCGVAVDGPLRARPLGAHGRLHVLCVGRLVPEKGQAVLLHAIPALVAREVDVTVTFVGDGPERTTLETLAHRLDIHGRVSFAGSLPPEGVQDALATADAFCLPSFAEGVPVVLMEAMAAGVPVVTTSITGIPELVVDGESGVLVHAGRPDHIADALADLAFDPRRRADLGAAGRARVAAEFDIDQSAHQLRKLFAGVAPADA